MDRVGKVINKMIENNGNVSKAMRESGYSKNYSRNPQSLKRTKKFMEEVKPILDQLKKKRQQALNGLTKKVRGTAGYRDLIYATDILTKNIQLLEGNPTEIIKNPYEELTQDEKISQAKRALRILEGGGETKSHVSNDGDTGLPEVGKDPHGSRGVHKDSGEGNKEGDSSSS